MAENEYAKDWVYVFVCEPGPQETFLGLYNKEKEVNFIPAFRTKEDANECYLELPREKGKKYELQAVHVEELFESAKTNGFVVTLVDGNGQVLDS